ALVCGRDRDLGSLSPSKLADLIVLDRDIYALEPMDIAQAKVEMTMVGGRIVHQV
ncbi:MAG: amidohydrolase family protein, partial [Deltaproteobacteria bacterium]|nr:amidohydrolase family protein [Deltaproteobacteria bacterium]